MRKLHLWLLVVFALLVVPAIGWPLRARSGGFKRSPKRVDRYMNGAKLSYTKSGRPRFGKRTPALKQRLVALDHLLQQLRLDPARMPLMWPQDRLPENKFYQQF